MNSRTESIALGLALENFAILYSHQFLTAEDRRVPYTTKYRINQSTIALFKEEGRHVAHTIPSGSIVLVNPETFNGNKLVCVEWAGKEVMMFVQDVESRGERLE